MFECKELKVHLFKHINFASFFLTDYLLIGRLFHPHVIITHPQQAMKKI